MLKLRLRQEAKNIRIICKTEGKIKQKGKKAYKDIFQRHKGSQFTRLIRKAGKGS